MRAGKVLVNRLGASVSTQGSLLFHLPLCSTLREAKKDCETILGNCRSLIDNDPLDALELEKEVTDGMESVRSHVACLSFQPLIRPSIQCTLSQGNEEAQLSSIMEGCKVVYDIQEEGENAEDSEEEEEGYEMESAAGYAAKAMASNAKGEASKKSPSVYSQDTQDPATVPTYFPTTGSTNRFSAFSGIEHPVASVSNWFHLEPPEQPNSPPRMHVGFGRPGPYFLGHASSHQGAAAATVSEEVGPFDLRPTTTASPTASATFLHPVTPKPALPSSFGPTSFLFSPSMDSDNSVNSDSEPEQTLFPTAHRYPFTIFLDGGGTMPNSSSLAERQQAEEEIRRHSRFSRQLSSSVVDSLQFRQRYRMNDEPLSDEEGAEGQGSMSGQFQAANGSGEQSCSLVPSPATFFSSGLDTRLASNLTHAASNLYTANVPARIRESHLLLLYLGSLLP